MRKGAVPVGPTVEFSPAGFTFSSPARVRQVLPAPQIRRVYVAYQSQPTTDTWVRRARSRKLPQPGPEGTEVWELDADTTGLWMFAEEDNEIPVATPDAGSPPVDAEPPPQDVGPALMAVLVPSPAIQAFGEVLIGKQAAADDVVIANAGNAPSGPMAVTFMSATPGVFDQRAGNTCEGANLSPAATCTLKVYAGPTQVGTFAGTVIVQSGSGASTTLALTVTGIRPPALSAGLTKRSFKPAPIDATGETLALDLENKGDLPTGPITFSLKGADALSFSVNLGSCAGG